MFTEIIKLEIENEINGFERTTLDRLLEGFDNIESEAAEKRRSFLDRKARSFDPDFDDEACIEESGFLEELHHISIEEALKQEFINSVATWLFHLFEKQKKRVFGSDQTDFIKPKLAQNGYKLDSSSEWSILNKELRNAANAIKHGSESDAAKELFKKYPNLFEKNCVILSKSDVERYISALRKFWNKVFNGQVILTNRNV
jgi:hypothetical protein